MSGVFISHAFADKSLVDEFIDTVVKLGCALKPEEIFYSSGEDTGIPSGSDLLSHVRNNVGEARLVVAIVSPTFQTRPVCIAELGAAWSRVDNLFPLAVPGMERTDMEGVLKGMVVRYLDEGAALDELHDRIGDAVGRRPNATTWGKYKAKWLAGVSRLVKALPPLKVVGLPELERLESDLQAARSALEESEEERAELREQLDEMSKTRSDALVRRIRLPKNDEKKFELLRAEAREALAKVPPIVQEAVWYELAGREMPWPDAYEDKYRLSLAQETFDEGLLVESGNEQLAPNSEFGKVAAASDAVRQLQGFLDEPSEAFEDWFRSEYDMPLDLRLRAVWDDVVG
jgi:hypothetical protein